VNELPSGWALAGLSEIANVVAGQAPPGTSYNTEGQGEPLFQGKTGFGALRLNSPRLWTTSPAKLAEHDDVLLSVRAPVGPTNLASTRCAIGRGLAAIRGREGISQKYLLYSLRATEGILKEKATGTTFEAITSGVVRDHQIAIAPTAEQERIVVAIEDLFAQLEAGLKSLTLVRRNLRQMRASILQKTAPDHSDTDAKTVPIDKTVRIVDYRGRTPPFSPSGVPHLRSFNVKNGHVDWAGCAYVSYATYDKYMSRGFPSQGDLLITTEAPMGEVAFAPTTTFCMAQRMMLLKPDPSVWDSEYLLYHLSSPWFQQLLRIHATGTTVQGISSRNFRPLSLWAPSLTRQLHLAAAIRQTVALVASTEDAMALQFERARSLHASILLTAFGGRLVAQDKADEPASVLLQRIASLHSTSPTTRTRRGRRPGSFQPGATA
jgi:type I restriction enzyme S subunit